MAAADALNSSANADVANAAATRVPRVSYGLPVRNGEDSIAKCLDSILGQDFADFEIVICDNQSTDRTREILEEYAAKDDRVRVCLNETNVGLVENFNRVFGLARGEYFRWIGTDDWLEPGYTRACVDALDRDPDASVATTFFGLHYERGGVDFEEFRGEYLESSDPVHRLNRLLWFFHAGAAVYEPTYAMMRREALARTGLFQIHYSQDWLLTTELCLGGHFVHVPECLFHRSWPEVESSAHYAHLVEMYPDRAPQLTKSTWRLMKAMFALVGKAERLAPTQKRAARWTIFWWCVGRGWRQLGGDLTKLRRGLGITRESLGAGGPEA